MKIAKVEAIPLQAPADKAISFAQERTQWFYTTIVRITTDDGIQGIGECICRRASMPAKVIVDDMLTPLILGRDPLDVEGIWNDMVKSERHRGHITGMFMEAVSGVDTALWDVICKYHNMPLGKFLGGYDRKSVPAYASSVMLNEPKVMAENAVKLAESGFQAIKVKIGTGCEPDIRIMRTVRAAVGDDIQLMVDANSFYQTASDAVYVGRHLEELNVRWFEEPVLPDNIRAYRTISQKLDMAVSAGESCFSAQSFLPLLEQNCIELAQPDICRCGGITESRRIANLAAAFGKLYAPHTGFSSSVCVFASMQLAAWAPNFTIYEYGLFGNPLQRITTKPIPEVKNGVLEIPREVGIGCELDESFVEKYRIDR